MMNRIAAALSLALVLIAPPLITPSLGAQEEPYRPRPIPTGKDAHTMASIDRGNVAIWRQLLLADCKATGALADPWREDIEQLVDAYAEIYGRGRPSNATYQTIYKLVERLQRQDCKLPLAQLAIGDARAWQRQPKAAAAPLAEVANVAKDHSPAFRMMLGVAREGMFLRSDDQERATRAGNDVLTALIELAASDELPKNSERLVLMKIMRQKRGEIGGSSADFIDRLEKRVGKDHYAVLVLRAKLHRQLAWDARGQGTASSVSEKKFGTFADHITKSAEYAAEATQRFPMHPEGPSSMLSAIGPTGAGPAEMRPWFDLAVAAQSDWDDAYRTYMHFLQPRWGGSQQALLKIGKECLETGSFDSSVPANYRLAIHYITLDSRSPLKVWAKSSVQRRLNTLDEGMLAAATTQRDKWLANTHRIMTLTLGGKFAEAVKIYEHWNKEVDARQLNVYGVTEDWLHKTLRPHVSDYKPAVITRRALYTGFETANGFAGSRPLKSQRDGSSKVEHDANWRQWLRDSFVAAYKEKGVHDEKWDQDAEKLLSAFGEIANGEITRADVALAIKLLEADCEDPLVRYVIVRTVKHVELDQRLGLLYEVLPKLEKRYPITFSWWGKFHFQELLRMYGRSSQAGALSTELRSHMVRATGDAVCGGKGRRQYIRALWGGGPFVTPGSQWLNDEAVAELKKVDGADPWLSHFVQGHNHAHRARFPKGTMMQRVEDIKHAAQHLREAWRIAPENPEAAAVMIHVATLDAEAAGGTPREWFDRAVAAQVDFSPAYSAFLDSLRPYYGGSVPAMYRFAVECLDSGRFDTGIPLWFARTLQRIQNEVDQPREAWAAVGVEERLEAMFDGYMNRKNGPLGRDYLQAGRCMTAWVAGDYDRALKFWREAGETLDPSWLEIIGVKELDLVEADLQFLAAKADKK